MKTYIEEAAIFTKAIQALANNQDNLHNFESYLSVHFAKWLEKFANTPEGIVEELKRFADMMN